MTELTQEDNKKIGEWIKQKFTVREIRKMLTCPLCGGTLTPRIAVIMDKSLDPVIQSVYELKCDTESCIFHTTPILAEHPKEKKEAKK